MLDTPTLTAISQLGAMGILILFVYKLPAIISAVKDFASLAVDKVILTQNEALRVNSGDIDRILKMTDIRFGAIEDAMNRKVDALQSMTQELKVMNGGITKMGEKVEDLKVGFDVLKNRVSDLEGKHGAA